MPYKISNSSSVNLGKFGGVQVCSTKGMAPTKTGRQATRASSRSEGQPNHLDSTWLGWHLWLAADKLHQMHLHLHAPEACLQIAVNCLISSCKLRASNFDVFLACRRKKSVLWKDVELCSVVWTTSDKGLQIWALSEITLVSQVNSPKESEDGRVFCLFVCLVNAEWLGIGILPFAVQGISSVSSPPGAFQPVALRVGSAVITKNTLNMQHNRHNHTFRVW